MVLTFPYSCLHIFIATLIDTFLNAIWSVLFEAVVFLFTVTEFLKVPIHCHKILTSMLVIRAEEISGA